jgi:hypothetical protein
MKPSNCDWDFPAVVDLFDFDPKKIGQGGYRNTGT